MTLIAADIMTFPVISVNRQAGMQDIARLMMENDISAVPVLEADGTLAGIVSDEDIIKPFRDTACQQRDWWPTMLMGEALLKELLDHAQTNPRTAQDIMVRPAVTASEWTSMAQIAELMVSKHVRRIPIVSNGKMVGIVSRRDLVRAITRAPTMLV